MMGERKLDIRAELLKQMDKKRMSQAQVAGKLNISRSYMTKIFRDKENVSFTMMLKLVKYLSPENELDLMAAYCYDVKQPIQIKEALEYSSINNLFNEMLHLIDLCLSHGSKVMGEYGRVYQIQYDYQKGLVSGEDFYLRIRNTPVADPTTKFLLSIQEIYFHHSLKEYANVKRILKRNENLFDEIPEGYVKNSFKIRIYQALSSIELIVDLDFQKSYEKATYILANTDAVSYKAQANYIMGLSCFFTNHENALKHLREARELYKQSGSTYGVNLVAAEISLLNFEWGIATAEYSPYAEVFNLILVSDFEAAKNALENIEDKNALYYYAMGLATKDKASLYKSLITHLNEGDRLLAELPFKALAKLGENVDLLNQIAKLEIASYM